MDGNIADSIPCAKGAICHSLDEFSKGRGARARVERLRSAIAEKAPSYSGLLEVFDQHLLSQVIRDAARRARAVDHLKRHWLDAASPTPFFPNTPVARLLAEGIVKTLDLSLAGKGGSLVPINAWWVPDSPDFRMLNFADVENGVTVSNHVTLMIMTPRPVRYGRSNLAIWGDVAEAHVTRRQGRSVATRRVRDM